MKPTEELKKEHRAIESMLRVLDKVCAKLDAGENVESDHLKQIVDFIKVFADKRHHGKEEDLLFPALEQAGIPRESGTIAVMLNEHPMMGEFVAGMSEAAHQCKNDGAAGAAAFVQNARRYINLLTQHIQKEEEIVFPIADQYLSAKTQAELPKLFERLEEEKIGAGKHEQLHELLNQLQAIYGA